MAQVEPAAKRDRLTQLVALVILPLLAGPSAMFLALGVLEVGDSLRRFVIPALALAAFALTVAVARQRGWSVAMAVIFGIAAVALSGVAFYLAILALLGWSCWGSPRCIY
jgi:hypothetical protein